jgi:hypothetical protein
MHREISRPSREIDPIQTRSRENSSKRGIMIDIDAFVIRGYENVIDHSRRLRDSSKAELERQEFQRRMDNKHRSEPKIVR